jgi:hypothetical protein
MLHKRDGDRVSEYPVDPAQIAMALATKMRFDTGLLSDNTLLIRQEGVKKIVAEYRPPQKTGLYLDGTETALRVPLPGLLLIRITAEDKNPQYGLFAVKQRPTNLSEPLFHAPLSNIFPRGNICWGTVQRVTDTALQSTALTEDWVSLLGSRFSDHGVSGKSKSHPADIRQKLIALEARKARTYPKSDLLSIRKTLGQMLGDIK